MLGAESRRTWWQRPVLLAGAAGVVTGVVIGGASHSLPASSTGPIGPVASGSARSAVTVTVAAPAVTLTQTRTITMLVTPAAAPVVGPQPAGEAATSPAATGSAASSAAATRAAAPKAHKSPPPARTATALCKDGTLSYAGQHQGACAHHGGVAHWYR